MSLACNSIIFNRCARLCSSIVRDSLIAGTEDVRRLAGQEKREKKKMARLAGIEPATLGFGGQYFSHLKPACALQLLEF
jgi:hypothetical protein